MLYTIKHKRRMRLEVTHMATRGDLRLAKMAERELQQQRIGKISMKVNEKGVKQSKRATIHRAAIILALFSMR
jgi:hypothetical protein